MLFWLGFFVVGWPVPDLVKYLMITLPTFLAIMVLYEFLVLRVNTLRILFGMKPVRPSASPDRRVPVTQPTG